MSNRNIIVFAVDGLQKKHLQAYGYKRKNTYYLNKTCKQGTKFFSIQPDTVNETELFYSLLTSVPAKARESELKYKPLVLPKILEKKGYITGAIFDKKTGFSENARKMFNFFFSPEEFGRPDKIMPLKQVSLQAEKFIEMAGNKPFFLFVNIARMQSAFITKNKIAKKYLSDKLYKRKRLKLSKQEACHNRVPLSKQIGVEKDLRVYLANYDAIIHEIDREFGAIQKIVSSNSITHKTLFLFFGFRGISLGERKHYFCIGDNLYNENIDLPLIVKGPEIKMNAFVSGIVKTIDLMPFLLEYLKIEQPKQVFGTNFFKAIESGVIPQIGFTEKKSTVIDKNPKKIIWQALRDENYKFLKKIELEIEYFKGIKNALHKVLQVLKEEGLRAALSEIKVQYNFFKKKKLVHKKEGFKLYYLPSDPEEKEDIEKRRPDKTGFYNKILENTLKKIEEKASELNSVSLQPIKTVQQEKALGKKDEQETKKFVEVVDRIEKRIETTAVNKSTEKTLLKQPVKETQLEKPVPEKRVEAKESQIVRVPQKIDEKKRVEKLREIVREERQKLEKEKTIGKQEEGIKQETQEKRTGLNSVEPRKEQSIAELKKSLEEELKIMEEKQVKEKAKQPIPRENIDKEIEEKLGKLKKMLESDSS